MKRISLVIGFLALSACGADGTSTGNPTGGSPSTGGAQATGGANTGGARNTGGNPATGGGANTGGTRNTGGNPATGGDANTGGSNRTGGSTTSGGATATGGANQGGAQSTGGNTSTGGSPDAGVADGSTGKSDTGNGACTDECPAPKGGLTIGCKKRFLYGGNLAWKNFGCDFGGKAAWGYKGVSGDKAGFTTILKEMKDNGVDVIRWWMFPALISDGILLDSPTSKNVTGIGGTLLADIEAALAIAAEQDVHIILTLFSFDNFKPDNTKDSIPGTKDIVVDDTKRGLLIDKVVKPIAKAVEASPNKDRMVAWDVINEPEWAITGSDPYGDQAFDGQTSLETITFAQMETFVKEVVTALHAESKAPVTVGSAAVKWAKAWSKVGLDYHDFHWYGWVDQYFSHKKTPTDYKVDDQPVVVGEFPFNPSDDTTGESFGKISYGTLVTDFFDGGYAGTMGWAFSDTTGGGFSWANAKTNVKAWADAHTCYTHY